MLGKGTYFYSNTQGFFLKFDNCLYCMRTTVVMGTGTGHADCKGNFLTHTQVPVPKATSKWHLFIRETPFLSFRGRIRPS